MRSARLTRISKYLALHLRHQPERLGLQLQADGWVEIEKLLTACKADDFAISPEELEEVVARNDKQRFSIDPTGRMVRANQGHSVPVNIAFEIAIPPPVLYHGTGEHNVAAIMKSGICRMRRHHVHLSSEVNTAVMVGARHGTPVVIMVNAAAMVKAGCVFHRSSNGVWLVDDVPPQFLGRLVAPKSGKTGQRGEGKPRPLR